MDNAQDANRIEGGGRFFSFSPAMQHISKQSGSVCDGGEVTVLEKSKKNQLKKLSALGEDTLSQGDGASGLGCVGSDGEYELRPWYSTCKRFKLPKKFSNDCNAVCHVSVPRKLRSATKKRSCKTISPSLPVPKKLNHVADGVEMLKRDDLMKSNLNKKQDKAEGCAKDGIPGPITKDEEEVAEALYALAGLFPNSAQSNKNKLVVERSRAISSASAKAESSVTPAEENVVTKAEVEPKTIIPRNDVSILSSNEAGSAAEVVILHSWNDTKQPALSTGKQPIQSHSDVQEVNLPVPAFFSENKYTVQRPSCESVVSTAWTEVSLEPGSMLLKPEKSLASWKYPEIALAPIDSEAACSQPEAQSIIQKNRDIGLSSMMLSDNEGCGVPLQSHTAKLPAWFERSSCISQSPISLSNVAKKDGQMAIEPKKSCKKCSTHAYICRFIMGFQITERRDRWPMQSTQISTGVGLKEGARKNGNGLIGLTNGLNGIVSPNGTCCSAPENNATEVRNAILLHKRLVQDQQHASTTSGIYISQKQSQYQLAIPFLLSHSYYSSVSFSGHPSAAAMQQVQLPASVASTPYGPPSLQPSASSAVQSEQQQQQQKRAPQLMAHYKSGVASPSVPKWQAASPDPSSMFHRTQILFPPPRTSIEVIGTKHAQMLQQQQQQGISATALLPPPTPKGQYHYLPSVYEGNICRGIHSENVPIRIISNQHI